MSRIIHIIGEYTAMPSSKNPCTVLLIPNELIELSKNHPEVICNLRPEQRPQRTDQDERRRKLELIKEQFSDTFFFDKSVHEFLKQVKPGDRVVMACQGFGEEVFTFVTDIKGIYWAGDYPRIDFGKRPQVVEKLFGHSNLWGAFILAIACVSKETELRAEEGFDLIIDIAERGGLTTIAKVVAGRERFTFLAIAHVERRDGSSRVFPKFMVVDATEEQAEAVVRSLLPEEVELSSLELLKPEMFEQPEAKKLIKDFILIIKRAERGDFFVKETVLKMLSFVYQLSLNRGAEMGVDWAVKVGK
jgi:hypothetical protein